ncbi:unnamed protein product [Acanthoscelides obtectus]|uniref:Uncharacterized protein n=1 Tax=Acanthoscelides obtectus TaxID=200917 RepID=A0A9P0PA35_ACAOB|nr:unnamed protein product [Acanthoscelides obtectus]CAK1670258.1 hypothetical protein AOBTE_LOCUS27515 [Acanthoscelides obtectus]
MAGQPGAAAAAAVGGAQPAAQSPSHRGVHRSISATHAKPNRRASSGGGTIGETLRTGPQPQVPTTPSNNHQSGFKRQNTVDSATIKENSARLNSRPASAQPKTATDNSIQVASKARTVSKNTTLSLGTTVGRRSTISYDGKSDSMEKTNIGDLPGSEAIGGGDSLRPAKGHVKSASVSSSGPESATDPLRSSRTSGGPGGILSTSTVGTGVRSGHGSGAAGSVASSAGGQQAFPRNASSRSTFHSGQTRPRPAAAAYGHHGGPLAGAAAGGPGGPHDSHARPSFFSKFSLKGFTKRI